MLLAARTPVGRAAPAGRARRPAWPSCSCWRCWSGWPSRSYQQRFTPVVPVTLLTDRIGNQLQTRSDVKIRGLIVGEVRSISTSGDGARIELALQPGRRAHIPRNVSARLLPKTLFGERYVELVPPAAPGPADRAPAT